MTAPDPARALDARLAAVFGVRLDSAPHLRGAGGRPESLVLAAEQLALAIGDRRPKRIATEEPDWTPAPAPSAAGGGDAHAAVRALLAWATAAGIDFEPIELRVAADGNRTVHARRDIAEGEALITVPRAHMLVDTDLAAATEVAPVAALGDALQSAHSVAAVWLAHERARRDSPWRAYLDALPPAFPWLPIFRSGAELAGLAGTRARAAVIATHADLLADHALIQRRVRGAAGLAAGDFAWGRAVALTRAFHVTIADVSHRALIPVADMFDHGAADTSWGYDDDRGAFVVTAARPLAAGEEIRAIYGRFENSRFLASYGFAVDDNPEDEVALRFAPADELRTDLAGHLVWGLPLAAPATLEVGTTFDERFRRALSVARLRAATPRELVAAADRGRFLRGDLRWLGGRLEGLALEQLAAAARAAQARLDRGAPARPPGRDPAWAETCARIRASERALLDQIVAFTAAARPLVASPSPWDFRRAAERIAEEATGADRLLRGYLLAVADELPR